MQLVEIDSIGAEPGEAVLDGDADVAGRAPTNVALVRCSELGGQDDLVPTGTQRLAQEGLALGPAVDVGGVEEVDAGIEGGIHHGRRLLTADAHTEVVAAQADDADLQRADRPRLHCASPPPQSRPPAGRPGRQYCTGDFS